MCLTSSLFGIILKFTNCSIGQCSFSNVTGDRKNSGNCKLLVNTSSDNIRQLPVSVSASSACIITDMVYCDTPIHMINNGGISAVQPASIISGAGFASFGSKVSQLDGKLSKVFIISVVCYVSVLLTIFMLFNEEVLTPYMDEIFHVDQVRCYCDHNFTYVSIWH